MHRIKWRQTMQKTRCDRRCVTTSDSLSVIRVTWYSRFFILISHADMRYQIGKIITSSDKMPRGVCSSSTSSGIKSLVDHTSSVDNWRINQAVKFGVVVSMLEEMPCSICVFQVQVLPSVIGSLTTWTTTPDVQVFQLSLNSNKRTTISTSLFWHLLFQACTGEV